ncbi:MAG: endopeptidase La [Muribaculaceae bacterium]|nr:endopeptidase La [Muribaculaceae bacterium]MBQ7205651.1 endopeptidase La [Muribaculaceae bacterium]
MIDLFDNIDNEMNDGGARVLPIITEIHEVADNTDIHDNKADDIPILPLRNMVLFPSMTMPVSVGREKSLKLIKEAEESHCSIAVICQYDSHVDDPMERDLYRFGTIANIIKVLELPDGSTNVILQGRSACQLGQVTSITPYLRGSVTLVEEKLPLAGDKEFEMLMQSIAEITLRMLRNMGNNGRDLAFAMKNIDNPMYLMNFLATNIAFDPDQKQHMLEERDVKKRGYLLYQLLTREEQLVEIKANIQERTREDLSQQQREHFLQQQIRTIQEELGTDFDDVDDLRERASAIKWSDAVQKHFEKELRKLERLNPQSPDYSVQYAYLDTMLNLPWDNCTEDNFDLKNVEDKLNSDHYGLEKVKDRILEHLAVLKLRGDLKAPILCLYGPPGVGKTSLGKSVADALNREYERISLGGLHDEAEIRGHRRTYIGAMPGRIIAALAKCGSNNPVIVLDEVDKVGQDFKGDPSSALLEVLDPEQNGHFHDNYLDVDYDLSKILFIATANSLATVSRPLLDRMEVIEINGYIPEEKLEIAKRHLIPKELDNNGFKKNEIKFGKQTILKIIDDYTRESGVRQLEKKIATVLRRVARHKASGDAYPTSIKVEDLKEYLGAPDYSRDKYEGNEFAGVVTGLAWTAVGGEILFVESSLARGKGEKLTLTGNLGDVMKESAIIALQYLRSHCSLFNIDPELFDKYNVHIHVPEGAIPKDGPSAGVTMVTSLASSFTQRRVKDHLAMTGEITLRGKVLPVGGIKEKILAAKRAGIKDIILCKDNRKDIEEINEMYLKGLTFHYVNSIKEVLDIALLPEKVKDAIEL